MADPSSMTKTEAMAAFLKEKRARLTAKVKSKAFQQRTYDAGLSVMAASAGAIVPAYMIAANPQREYLDENRTIETEAVVAFGLGLAGVAAYVADVDFSTPMMAGGLGAAASYLGKVARQRAQANIAG